MACEEVKLLALVNSLPPVSAPADFNFRLSGRLAQAKAEKIAWNPLAWLAEFWANSFSLGQVGTAMAAVALIVAFSAVQLTAMVVSHRQQAQILLLRLKLVRRSGLRRQHNRQTPASRAQPSGEINEYSCSASGNE
jgi:hypothetical protein